MAGAMFVWLAPLMVRLTQPDSPIPMTTEDTSWLSAIIEISEGLATIPAGLLADRYLYYLYSLLVFCFVWTSFICILLLALCGLHCLIRNILRIILNKTSSYCNRLILVCILNDKYSVGFSVQS